MAVLVLLLVFPRWQALLAVLFADVARAGAGRGSLFVVVVEIVVEIGPRSRSRSWWSRSWSRSWPGSW